MHILYASHHVKMVPITGSIMVSCRALTKPHRMYNIIYSKAINVIYTTIQQYTNMIELLLGRNGGVHYGYDGDAVGVPVEEGEVVTLTLSQTASHFTLSLWPWSNHESQSSWVPASRSTCHVDRDVTGLTNSGPGREENTGKPHVAHKI